MRTAGPDEAELPAHPTVLLVDDNRDLLHFLERLMAEAGWKLLTAESATERQDADAASTSPTPRCWITCCPTATASNWAWSSCNAPRMLVIVMTGTILPPEEEALCEEHDFPVLRKPFLASDVMNQIRSRLTPAAGAGAR